ncbi:hypothetical protein GGI07_005473 [Coemansia sp. Benny D115]|nr:hypothetical protein GGI07_005473 [Coemansia sp. Benny D115]
MRFSGFNKYRNAAATVAGREAWYSELSIDASTSIASNAIAVDDSRMYIKTANGHGLQALALDTPGKVGQQAQHLEGTMSGRILDWNTALHSTELLTAGDDQGTVAVWRAGAQELSFKAHASGCASAQFHPTVANVLVTSASTSKSGEIKLWSVDSGIDSSYWQATVDGCAVDSVAVRGDGQLVSAITHNGSCLVYDPRQRANEPGSPAAVAKTAVLYAPGRPTRVLWLGEKPFLLTTGLSRMRERSAALWDQRNLAKPLATLVLQPSTKPLVPLYDEDTQLAYLVEKGDNAVRWVDADPSAAKPLAELGSVVLTSQISGCSLTPKSALKVMAGEIARIHVVVENAGAGAGSAVVPVSHVAPRRSYLDFHPDLFPDTRAPLPAQSFEHWAAGASASVPRMSLDPAKSADSLAALRKIYGSQATTSLQPAPTKTEDALPRPTGATSTAPILSAPLPAPVPAPAPAPALAPASSSIKVASPSHSPLPPPAVSLATPPASAKPSPIQKPSAIEVPTPSPASSAPRMAPSPQPATPAALAATDAPASPRPAKKQWVPPVQQDHARFKYLEGFQYKPSEHFTSLMGINQRFSQENDPIKANAKFIAVACDGVGGQVGIMRRDSPGRMPAKLPTIVHGASVVSIEFDPFDPNTVATAGADGKLQMWQIPNEPLSEESVFELSQYICVTADRIHQVRFHPWARGVVAVLVSEGTEQAIYVYDGLMLHFIVGKTADGIHSFAWSPDGELLALTTRKSRQLRVYDPRTQELVVQGPSMDSIRPCRIAWMDSRRLCLAGFGSGSQRQVAVYNLDKPAHPVAKATIDVGPGLLVPYVDQDCSIVYLDDRGSRLTHAFELLGDRLIELPKFESPQPGLGLAMVPKRHVNVAQTEVALAYRLNAQSIEPLGFKVPRKRPEYFQDDLFPPTLDVESPAVDAVAWVGGSKAQPNVLDLCPPGMLPLSQAPPEVVRRKTVDVAFVDEGPKSTAKDTINAMLSRLDDSEDDGEGSDAGSGSDWET